MANLFGVPILLVGWYLIEILEAVYHTKIFDIGAMVPLFYRFIVQYFLILFHSSFIIVAGTVTKNRVVASMFTIAGWLLYGFIQVKDGLFFDFVVSSYRWEKPPGFINCYLAAFITANFFRAGKR